MTRCLAVIALLPLAAAWVATRPTRRPTQLAAKKKSRKLERLQELKEVSGAELDATEKWAANLEQRLDAVASDGERDAKASKVLELCNEDNRDFDAIDAAVKDLASLPAYPDIGFRARGDWRLVWAKSDEGVGFIGTGLHRVALANLEDQFLSLDADGSCALTEVIRVLGPFPNVKNLLTGTSTIGPSTLRLTYTKVIDGTGAELTSSQARSVKLRLAALSKDLLVVAAASVDADDWLVFEREDNFADALESLRVPPNTPDGEEEDDSGGFKMPKMPWDKKE